MKLAVIGSRNFKNYNFLEETLENFNNISEIVSGGARGADSLAEKYAKENNIKLKVFPAWWNLYGNAAGYIRNKEIIDYCDEVVAFWDTKSKGTKHSIDLAKKSKKRVYIIEV